MASSLYQQLNPQTNNKYVQLYKMLKSSNNPQQLLMNLASQDPQVKQIIDILKMSNKSPQDLFLAAAKSQGANPDDILNMLK